MPKLALLPKLERCEVMGLMGQCKVVTSHKYQGLSMCSNCFYHAIMNDAKRAEVSE